MVLADWNAGLWSVIITSCLQSLRIWPFRSIQTWSSLSSLALSGLEFLLWTLMPKEEPGQGEGALSTPLFKDPSSTIQLFDSIFSRDSRVLCCLGTCHLQIWKHLYCFLHGVWTDWVISALHSLRLIYMTCKLKLLFTVPSSFSMPPEDISLIWISFWNLKQKVNKRKTHQFLLTLSVQALSHNYLKIFLNLQTLP